LKPNYQWFLRSHCTDVGATFAFCTDCGTYFDKACLKELTRYLEDNDDVSACCGRQRIMEKHVQDEGDPERDEAVGESSSYRRALALACARARSN
jgi:hypothetical protein